MRRLFPFAAVLISGAVVSGNDNLKTRHYTVDGMKRVALVHVPGNAKDNPTPVVFAFHGHGGSMQVAAKSFATHKHWPEAIVVYMEGVPTKSGSVDPEGKKPGWQYHAGENGDRDLNFFDAVLAELRDEFKVDDKRVYVEGFSNGAGFAFLLWSTGGDRIAAVAACAMHADAKMISTFKPRALLQIAGKTDMRQKLAVLEKTVKDVCELNQCGAGQPWEEKCTVYPSKIGAPVVLYVHPGGHEVPHDAAQIIVIFFKRQYLGRTGKS